jgi:biotin transport system substrate-specific component
VVIYVPGLIWLAGFVGGAEEAFAAGLAPFWIGDLLKIALAAGLLPSAWWLTRRML